MSGYHLALALGFSAGGLVVRVSGFGVRDRAWGLQGARRDFLLALRYGVYRGWMECCCIGS